MHEELQQRVHQMPTEPGVYRWLDADGNVLYIGKAKNLRARLRSYVQKPDASLGPWKRALIERIADVDVTVTTTELEALILETNLIKENRPKYNVMMKDDKNYVYACITMYEHAPKLEIIRRMIDKKAKHFGPFLSSYHLRRTLDVLQEVIGYRACTESIERFNRDPDASASDTPCLEHQIGQCNGLCIGEVSLDDYTCRMEEVVAFFRGRHAPVLDRARDLMKEAATRQQFERAAKLRDAIQFIESLAERQYVSDPAGENVDAMGVILESGKAQAVILRVRNGRVVDEHALVLSGEPQSLSAALMEFIPQYYDTQTDIPPVVLISEDLEEVHLLEVLLGQNA